MCFTVYIFSDMNKLPLEIVNYLCTFLPVQDIKATFSDEKILASGVALDLWKAQMKIKDEIQNVLHQLEIHMTGEKDWKKRFEYSIIHNPPEETILMHNKMCKHLDNQIVLLEKLYKLLQELSCY